MYCSNESSMATLLQQKNCMKTLTNGGGSVVGGNNNNSSSGAVILPHEMVNIPTVPLGATSSSSSSLTLVTGETVTGHIIQQQQLQLPHQIQQQQQQMHINHHNHNHQQQFNNFIQYNNHHHSHHNNDVTAMFRTTDAITTATTTTAAAASVASIISTTSPYQIVNSNNLIGTLYNNQNQQQLNQSIMSSLSSGAAGLVMIQQQHPQQQSQIQSRNLVNHHHHHHHRHQLVNNVVDNQIQQSALPSNVNDADDNDIDGDDHDADGDIEMNQNQQLLQQGSDEIECEPEPVPEIDIVINNVVCSFSVGCHLSLRQIALSGFNVEFRRENGMVTMKLRRPYTTASIWSSGKITCTGATSEEQARIAARRYARCLQKLNFSVKFKNFRVVNVLGTCSMPWAIKIVNFSEKYKKDASYEPELHPGVTYKLKIPKATLKIFSTGSITVTAGSVAHVQAAIEHIFPLVYEFRKKRPVNDENKPELQVLPKNINSFNDDEHSGSVKRKRPFGKTDNDPSEDIMYVSDAEEFDQ